MWSVPVSQACDGLAGPYLTLLGRSESYRAAALACSTGSQHTHTCAGPYRPCIASTVGRSILRVMPAARVVSEHLGILLCAKYSRALNPMHRAARRNTRTRFWHCCCWCWCCRCCYCWIVIAAAVLHVKFVTSQHVLSFPIGSRPTAAAPTAGHNQHPTCGMTAKVWRRGAARFQPPPNQSTYQAPLLIVCAVDEHTADVANCHGALWLRQLLVQGVVLPADCLCLLGDFQCCINVAHFTQLCSPSHQLCGLQEGQSQSKVTAGAGQHYGYIMVGQGT